MKKLLLLATLVACDSRPYTREGVPAGAALHCAPIHDNVSACVASGRAYTCIREDRVSYCAPVQVIPPPPVEDDSTTDMNMMLGGGQ